MQSVFWLNNPLMLVDKNHITELWPKKNNSLEEKLNAMTRFIIVLSLLGFLISGSAKVLVSGVVTLAIIVLLYLSRSKKKTINIEDLKKEGFTNREVYDSVKSNFTTPKKENPLMNVLMNEYDDNPQRKAAAPSFNKEVDTNINESVKKNLIEDQGVDERLFQDLGDNFVFDQSMRNFYTTANTRIPNDQRVLLNIAMELWFLVKKEMNLLVKEICTKIQIK